MQATVLSIAGSDPTGGAGIQADLKTMTSIGVYGAAVITCITAQNSHGVVSVECLPPNLVQNQIQSVLDDHLVTHVKIGMVGSAEIATAIIHSLSGFCGEIIYDPVMLSTTGQSLSTDSHPDRTTLPIIKQATVLTPNIPELEQITGMPVNDHQNMIAAAGLLLEKNRRLRVILVKGGHFMQENSLTDIMVHRTAEGLRSAKLTHPSVQTMNTHGTGCTLASAFAAFHALSCDDLYSFRQSIRYVNSVLQNSKDVQIIRNRNGHGGMLHYSFEKTETATDIQSE